MATGDVKNNLRKLLTELKRVHYPQYVDSDGSANGFDFKALANGQPQAFLPILHFVFLDYSYLLAQYLAERDYELYAKTDLRFVEVVYRILRNEFSFKPQLTKEQFLTTGFAEQKIILLCTILKLCQDKLKHLDGKDGRARESKMKLSYGTRRSLKSNSSAGHPRSSNQTEKTKEFGKTSTIPTRKSTKKPLFPQTSIIREVDVSDNTSKKNVTSEGGQNRIVASSSNPLVSISDVSYACQDENKENQPEENNNHCMTRMPRKECLSLRNTIEENISSAKCVQKKEQSFVAVDQEIDKSVNSPWSRLQKKCVRWEDEALNGQHHSVTCASTSRDHFTPAPGFEPHENWTKQALPAPSIMATVPQPSPDLMLTPISKAKHQLIPISEAKRIAPESCGSNVSLIDITGCDDIKESHVHIVRHSNTAKVTEGKGRISDVVESGKLHGYKNCQQEQSNDDFLKCQLMEIKVKLEKLLSLNNHMSSQIVLLETRVKLLEEQQNNFLSSNTGSHHKQPNHLLELPNCTTNEKDKGTLKLTENFEWESVETNAIKTSRTSSDESERSLTGSDEGSSDENCVKELHVKDPGETTNIVHTPKVTFVDPSTKTTVLNVHKRLKETREMLTKTNRSYATRFNQASLSEIV